jgi:FkbM family methyltransferase
MLLKRPRQLVLVSSWWKFASSALRKRFGPFRMSKSQLFCYEVSFLERLIRTGYRPSGAVFDIGASTGIWSEVIGTVLPDVEYELFEPLAIHAGYASDVHARLERLGNLRLHTVALGDRNGEQTIFVARDMYGSSLRDRGDIPEVEDRITVPVVRLDDFAAQKSLPPASIIKIDCQGAENAIIEGGIGVISKADILFIETWLKRGYGPDTPLLTEIIAMLQPLSFSLVEFGERFYDEQHRLYSVDAFFCSERLLEQNQVCA